MDKFLEFMVDNIGAFILFVFAGMFIWSIRELVEADKKTREDTRRLTEACYSQGMVPVYSDAGQRCADPRSIVKAK